MKKALMGTTALVAAAVTTGVAADEMMAEPISLTIGGNSHWGVAIVDNEANSDANDDVAFSNDVELRFARHNGSRQRCRSWYAHRDRRRGEQRPG